ncbi:unnamed protein product [Prunus armeniaca]
MSDKASCSNVRAPELDKDNPTNDVDVDAAENRQDQTQWKSMLAPLLEFKNQAPRVLRKARGA